MAGVGTQRLAQMRDEFGKVAQILESYGTVDKSFLAPTEEFVRRQRATYESLRQQALPVGLVFSDEHYFEKYTHDADLLDHLRKKTKYDKRRTREKDLQGFLRTSGFRFHP